MGHAWHLSLSSWNWKRANDSVEKSLELLSRMSRPYPIGYSYNWLCASFDPLGARQKKRPTAGMTKPTI